MTRFRRRSFWGTLIKLEKTFLRIIVLGFVLLAFIQFSIPVVLPTDFTTRTLVLNDSFEGEKEILAEENLTVEAMKTEKYMGSITFRLENFASMQKAKILVNGEEVADFAEKEVTIGVNNNDEIAIDSSYYKRALKVTVCSSSSNLKQPKVGQEYLITTETVTIGQVRVEE